MLGTLLGVPAGNDVTGVGDVEGAIAFGSGERVSSGVTDGWGAGGVGCSVASVVLLVADAPIERLKLKTLSL